MKPTQIYTLATKNYTYQQDNSYVHAVVTAPLTTGQDI